MASSPHRLRPETHEHKHLLWTQGKSHRSDSLPRLPVPLTHHVLQNARCRSAIWRTHGTIRAVSVSGCVSVPQDAQHLTGREGALLFYCSVFLVAYLINTCWLNTLTWNAGIPFPKIPCHVSPGRNYQRKGFLLCETSTASGERSCWRCPKNRKARLCLPVGDELRATSKNSGVSWDEHTLQRPTWEDKLHNRVQGMCLWADVRTVQEGFGSLSDAMEEGLAGWLDTTNDTYHPNGI